MIQFSLYGRICNTIESAKLHESKISLKVPPNGSVGSLIVTEKQYASMRILVGEKLKKEKNISSQQISFFLKNKKVVMPLYKRNYNSFFSNLLYHTKF